MKVLGLVPRTAAAAWELAGVTLGVRACEALRGGCPDAVVVELEGAPDAVPALRAPLDVVVVHDPSYPLVRPELVVQVLAALAAAPADVVGAVAVRPVTDTLKEVAPDGTVVATADRERFRVVCTPQAYRATAFRAALAAAVPPDGAAEGLPSAERLPAAVGAHGRLVTVPAPQEVFRVADGDELELAEAVLRAGDHASR